MTRASEIALSLSGHSESFKVIIIGVSRKPEQGVAVTYNNVDLISKTDGDIPIEKLQIRRLQLPQSGFTTDLREKPSNIHRYIFFDNSIGL